MRGNGAFTRQNVDGAYHAPTAPTNHNLSKFSYPDADKVIIVTPFASLHEDRQALYILSEHCQETAMFRFTRSELVPQHFVHWLDTLDIEHREGGGMIYLKTWRYVDARNSIPGHMEMY